MVALGTVILAGYGLDAWEWARSRAREGGVGFGDPAWRTSATIALVRGLPTAVPVYSNAPEALQLFAERPSRLLPWRAGEHRRRSALEQAPRVRGALRDGAVIVWLDALRWRAYLLHPVELRRVAPLRRAHRFADGSIWVHDPEREAAGGG